MYYYNKETKETSWLCPDEVKWYIDEDIATEFTEKQISKFKEMFGRYDQDGSGEIDTDELTEAFFQTAKRMMRSGEHLWMAMEKRFNFSIEEMSVVAHGYKRLMKYVSDVDGAMPFRGSRIPLSFSQRVMSYDRVVDLEMWDIVKI
jgi:hypothetical protein